MRTAIVLFVVVLALALASVASANNRPLFAGNTGNPGNFDNCAGVAFKGAPNSDGRNANPGRAFHACND
jgi:hypothetical protein